MTEEDKKCYRNNKICLFMRTTLNVIKFEIIVIFPVDTEVQLRKIVK